MLQIRIFPSMINYLTMSISNNSTVYDQLSQLSEPNLINIEISEKDMMQDHRKPRAPRFLSTEQLLEQNVKLQEECRHLRSDVKKKQSVIADLQRQNKSLLNWCHMTTTNSAFYSQENVIQLEKKKKTIASLEQKIVILVNKDTIIQNQRLNLESCLKKEKELNGEILEKNKDINFLHLEMIQFQEKIKSYLRQLKEKEYTAESLKKQNKHLQQQIVRISNINKQQKQQAKEKDKNILKLRKQLQSTKQQVSSHIRQLAQKESTISRLYLQNKNIKYIENELKFYKQENKRLQSDSNYYEKTSNVHKQAHKEYGIQIAKLISQNRKLHEKIPEFKNKDNTLMKLYKSQENIYSFRSIE